MQSLYTCETTAGIFFWNVRDIFSIYNAHCFLFFVLIFKIVGFSYYVGTYALCLFVFVNFLWVLFLWEKGILYMLEERIILYDVLEDNRNISTHEKTLTIFSENGISSNVCVTCFCVYVCQKNNFLRFQRDQIPYYLFNAALGKTLDGKIRVKL